MGVGVVGVGVGAPLEPSRLGPHYNLFRHPVCSTRGLPLGPRQSAHGCILNFINPKIKTMRQSAKYSKIEN